MRGNERTAALHPDIDAKEIDALATAIAAKGRTRSDLVCPGQNLAATCGNFSCDTALGEGDDSCPADCRFHRVGAYNLLPICEDVQDVVTPTNAQEVSTAVRAAVASGRRVRVIGKRHSASGAICGDGVALSTEKLADVATTEIRNDVAYVAPGVTMKEIEDWLRPRGYSLGYAHLGFNGVSVAGAIGTSAHGSSPRHTNALSSRVVSFEVVGPDGVLRTYEQATTKPTIWRALQTNLGFLGVVTRVGLALEKAFDLDTVVDYLADDALFAGSGATSLIAGCDWGQLNWFPGQHKVVRWCGMATSAPAEAGAHNVLLDPGVSASLVPIAKGSLHAGTCNASIACLTESIRYNGLVSSPPIVKAGPKGDDVHVTRAVGPGYDMMSAALIDLGKNVYFQMDWEVAVPARFAQPALELARKVFAARNVCLPGVGAFLRFGLIEEGGWLSYHSAGGDFEAGKTALFFETPVTVPAGYPQDRLDEYLALYHDVIRTLIERFGARAHWGKNLDGVFDDEVAAKTFAGRIEGFNEAVAELDPYGVFANDFGRRIGVVWPQGGDDFSRSYAANTCGCTVAASPVCDRRSQASYANACRATCEGRAKEDLLDGVCERYRFVTEPLSGLHLAYRGRDVFPTSSWR